ncbi:MAG: 1-deoxy-D-xylulose-5-phosphate reductoisomerase, partial [Alphaproteobacteria bacterium]
MSEPTSLTILGATGSVGRQAQAIVKANAQCFQVEALAARQNAHDLARAARELNAKYVALLDPDGAPVLKQELQGSGIQWGVGVEAVIEAAARPAERVVAAIVGTAGLAPTMTAIERGATIALANKEALVIAGNWFMQQARISGAKILPVDSEHNAIFQLLDGFDTSRLERLILTASGGPFFSQPQEKINLATPQEACKHPVWSMGVKNSVDSASFMNKGLEIIEAHHLFDLNENQIDVLVHPQSLVHAMIACKDGAILAHIAPTNMQLPIAHALLWPNPPPPAP